MHFSIVICTVDLYQEAKNYFLQQWRSDLASREQNSLIWAYLITQHMHKSWKTWFSFVEWVYTYEDLYFSTSHTWDLLMIAIDTKKVAVDIEYTHPRDASLLYNINMPHSPYSPWENFYIQWSAKECLVKFLNLTSMEIHNMSFVSFDPHSHYVIDEWEFEWVITLRYKWVEYPIRVDIRNGRVMTIIQDTTTQTTTYASQTNSSSSSAPTGMFKPID